MIDLTQETKIWLTAAILVLIASVLGFCIVPSHGHDGYEKMTIGTACSCGTVPIEQLCEPVEVIAVPGRAGYYLPASGEFIPLSWAMTSPDERFHRCTFPRNMMWRGRGAGQGPEGWVEVPNKSTLDGKPPTRCFFHPMVGF